ncbi:MAG TPA: 2-C-methyl-D-erythritol 4-phosphate cytidylyltransferase [Candidatus Obscuribacterales bacterium]
MAEPQARVRLSAVLVAAGTGSRFADAERKRAKQFVDLCGRPMYLWPLRALVEHGAVEQVVLATLPDMVPVVEAELQAGALAMRVRVIAGGATRQESVWLGLRSLAEEPAAPEFVLIHDAARPLLTPEIIDRTVDVVAKYGACTTCVPVADTIKRVHDGFVLETVSRENLVLVQTPQAARLAWLLEAHQLAKDKRLEATDDAAVLESAGYPVAVVTGALHNLKVTRPEDMIVAEALCTALLVP